MEMPLEVMQDWMGPLDGRALALDGDGCGAHALLIMPMMETSLHVHEFLVCDG